MSKYKLILKIKLAFFLLIGAILTVGLSACTKKTVEKDPQLLIYENPKSLDPAMSSDVLSAEQLGATYEQLFQYHYLKRPYQIIPLLAESLPEFSKDGLTLTIKIKKGIHFQNDPCFPNGQGRELVADDFHYAIRRLADPKTQTDGWWIFDGKIKGLNEWRKNAEKNGPDYKAPIEGIQVVDSHTLRIKLVKKYPQLVNVLAMVYTAPMPHEAVEKYGPEITSHPVGTGPFMLKEYVRGSHLIWVKNTNYHGENFPDRGVTDPEGLDYGKPLPLSDRIVVNISLEDQPAWLKFMSGQLDWMRLPKDNFKSALTESRNPGPEFVKKEIQLTKDPSTTTWFLGFNMQDPVVGGKNSLLRKAIGLAYDSSRDIELFTNGLGVPANQILPASIAGYVKDVPPRETNLEKAKALLAKAGYPEGKGLPQLVFDVESSSRTRQIGEFFKAQMAQIGIDVLVQLNTRPQLLEKKRKGKLQVHMDGWMADYPDAENFMQLLYGPNKVPGPNNSSFDNSEFNTLYEKMSVMSPGAERDVVIKMMTNIFLQESPWIPNWTAVLYHIHQSWLKNYVYSDFSYNNYKYYRVDLEKKKAMQSKF